MSAKRVARTLVRSNALLAIICVSLTPLEWPTGQHSFDLSVDDKSIGLRNVVEHHRHEIVRVVLSRESQANREPWTQYVHVTRLVEPLCLTKVERAQRPSASRLIERVLSASA